MSQKERVWEREKERAPLQRHVLPMASAHDAAKNGVRECETSRAVRLANAGEEFAALVLAREVDGGRQGRVFREPRDDHSIYRWTFGPEDRQQHSQPPSITGYWDAHQFYRNWRPLRRLHCRTRLWRAWNCYAFACKACGHHNYDYHGFEGRVSWKAALCNVDSLKCSGCGAGAFEMQ